MTRKVDWDKEFGPYRSLCYRAARQKGVPNQEWDDLVSRVALRTQGKEVAHPRSYVLATAVSEAQNYWRNLRIEKWRLDLVGDFYEANRHAFGDMTASEVYETVAVDESSGGLEKALFSALLDVCEGDDAFKALAYRGIGHTWEETWEASGRPTEGPQAFKVKMTRERKRIADKLVRMGFSEVA